MSVLEALRPVLAEYGTLSGLSPTAFHTTHCGRTLSSSGMLSAFTESNRLFGAVISLMYNATTPSIGGGAALGAAPQTVASTLLGSCGRRSRCRTCGRRALRSQP